jgi:hypothetical protein
MGVVLMLLPGVALVRLGVLTVGQGRCPSVALRPRTLAFLRPCPACEPLPTSRPDLLRLHRSLTWLQLRPPPAPGCRRCSRALHAYEVSIAKRGHVH